MSVPGRYSRVSRRIWNDEKVRRLTPPQPCGQSLFVRLLVGPEQNNIPGLFQIWESGFAESLGWDLKGFREAFAEVSREGLVKASWKVGLVWVPNSIRHNEPANPNVVLSWETAWSELPDCELKTEAYRVLLGWAKDKGNAWLKAFQKACPNHSLKGMAKQEQDQDQEQEKEEEPPADDIFPHPTSEARPKPIDPMRDQLNGSQPGQRPDVVQVHELWKSTFGKAGAKIGNPNGALAILIRDTVRDYGLDDCLAVVRQAPNDGMVNGKDDEHGKKHDDLFYILAQRTFDRLLVASKKTRAHVPKQLTAIEQIAAAKARGS